MSRTLPCLLCEHPDLHGPGVCSLVPLRAQECFWRHPWKIPDAPTTCLSYSQMRSALPGCSQPLLSLDILPRISLKLNHFHGVAPCPALQCVSYIRQTGMVSRPPPGRVPAVSLRQLPYTFLGPHPSSSQAAPPRRPCLFRTPFRVLPGMLEAKVSPYTQFHPAMLLPLKS